MTRLPTALFLLTVSLGLSQFSRAQYDYNDYHHHHYVPPITTNQWKLGVNLRNLEGGCEVTTVFRGSVAERVGIKVGDVILSVNGTPVGYAYGRLYDFSDVVNSRADAYGRVTLSVREKGYSASKKFGPTKMLTVRLTPAGVSFPGQAYRPPTNTNPRPENLPSGRPPYRPPGATVLPEPVPPIYEADRTERRIQRWYSDYLGRLASHQELSYWTNMVARGTNVNEVQVGILSSSEFYDRSGNSPTIYTRLIFQRVTGQNPTENQLRIWTDRLDQTYRGDRTRYVRAILSSLGMY